MSEFDYGNARLRAMKSRLLSRATLEELTEVGSVQGLITALTSTAYRQAVEAALIKLTDIECLVEALRSDLVATLGKARTFYAGREGQLVTLALGRYDLHNVKTILRGLARHVPANEILANMLPIAELRPADMAELTRAADVRIAIDLLATWRLRLAQPLLQLRALQPDRNITAELFEMEAALDRWYFETAMREASDTVLLEALALDADVINIVTALRLVGVPGAAAILRDRFGSDDVTVLFVGPGVVPFAVLQEVTQQKSVPEAIGVLADTTYGSTLVTALDRYAALSRLSVFERALTQRQLRHAAHLIIRDPLGIGVLLGYAALKTNEVANIRAIAHGLMIGEPPNRIRDELMMIES